MKEEKLNSEEFPALDSSLEDYYKALKIFGKDKEFTPTGLVEAIEPNSPSRVKEELSRSYYTHFYQLSMYGIMKFYGKNQFKIDLSLDDSAEEWKEKLGSRGLRIREYLLEQKPIEIKNDEILPLFIGREKKAVNAYLSYVFGKLDEKRYGYLKIIYSMSNDSEMINQIEQSIGMISSGYKFEKIEGPIMEPVKTESGKTWIGNTILYKITLL